MGRRQGCGILTLLHYPRTWFSKALFRKHGSGVLLGGHASIVKCLFLNVLFDDNFFHIVLASLPPPLPLSLWRSMSLAPLSLPLPIPIPLSWHSADPPPYSCTLLFLLILAATRSLLLPKHALYCCIPYKGFFQWVNKTDE